MLIILILTLLKGVKYTQHGFNQHLWDDQNIEILFMCVDKFYVSCFVKCLLNSGQFFILFAF